MDQVSPQKVIVVHRDSRQTFGEVRIQHWDKATRTKRALKMLGLCWVGAILAIPLPIVHFLLVPGLFLAGIAAAFFVSDQKSVVLGGTADCPGCGAELPIVRGPDRWPLNELCAKCQTTLTVEKAL